MMGPLTWPPHTPPAYKPCASDAEVRQIAERLRAEHALHRAWRPLLRLWGMA